jgi:hypothetical protein
VEGKFGIVIAAILQVFLAKQLEASIRIDKLLGASTHG